MSSDEGLGESRARQPVVFDMETSDPDDVLALALIADHPAFELVALTVNPGTDAQLGVVTEVLRRVGVGPIPMGSRTPGATREAVSPFHFAWLGHVPPVRAEAVSSEVLAEAFRRFPRAVLLTGAPLHNLRLALKAHPEMRIERWVAQGGFAGDNLVPPAHQLPKFVGRELCESHNFGGDSKGTLLALGAPQIGVRQLVSKNVTHALAWDGAFHALMAPHRTARAGLAVAYDAMSRYQEAHPEGKLLHDPLAAAAVIEPGIFTWSEVEVIHARGQWGARAASGTATFMTTSVDTARVLGVLIGGAQRPPMRQPPPRTE
ncbi:nucleoside hydrolase [Stigmatella sp. ncwal1]|uniref:Nucleoside hydrolase n=1 Tax=Stigmatella ashevillensis TaxID=2995309 RepID=A0ABT5DEP0_9BACT|nr:nucleoside hydrolase [Stigmatella ashevillena]MDC0711583.1 nucleoside hydrolase [Stigmatella ashevillena]